ncbi:MAG: OmpA family protein [Deltaproteobacteria bacterium]|nr:OmpA family protein [Deltaproteobacteria bacterium]
MNLLCLLFLLNAALIPRVHFDSNSFSIPSEEKIILNQNVVWLKENPKEVIILEGHCDEWGDAFYNMELGDRRAREVKAYLMEEGVDPERIIMIVSYGSKRPLDLRHENEAWKLNRRVEFVMR